MLTRCYQNSIALRAVPCACYIQRFQSLSCIEPSVFWIQTNFLHFDFLMFHDILLILETNSKLFVYLKKGKSIKQHPDWHSDAIYCFVHLVNMCAKGISYAGSTDGMYYLQKMRY